MDILPPEAGRYTDIAQSAAGIARFYGFEEITASPIEAAAALAPLVRAGMLDERPPVRCEIGQGEALLMSPSGALGVARAYFSHRMQSLPQPLKLFFRSRGFSQSSKQPTPGRGPDAAPVASGLDRSGISARDEWGVVVIGEESAVAETEIAQIFYRAATELGLGGASLELRLNAVGCAVCRAPYRASLTAYLRRHAGRLCARSRREIRRAPTRIFSCAEERCRGVAAGAPQALDFLCVRCKKQLKYFLEFLDEAGIPYSLDPRFFRDGSWYTEIVFALLCALPDPPLGGSGSASASDPGEHDPMRGSADEALRSAPGEKCVFAEGGRISQAAALIGGKDTPAAAGVLFLDAIAAAAARRDAPPGSAEVFFVQLGDLAKRRSFEILETLREAEIDARESLGRDSIKIQLKIAERVGARFAVILGQKEALDGTIIVRETGSGIQETVPQEKLTDFLKKKLKK